MSNYIRTNRLSRLTSLISIAIAIITYLKFPESNFEFPIYLLPITFLILWLFSSGIKQDFLRCPGVTVIISIMFIRYLIMPLVLIINGSLSVFAKDYCHLTQGIILMIIEMLGIFLALNLSEKNFHVKMKMLSMNTRRNYKIVENDIFAIVAFTVVAFLFVTDRSLTVGLSLITKGYVNESGILDENSSVSKLVWQALTTWLYVYAVYRCRNKYDMTHRNRHMNMAIVYTLLFLLITYISQNRISRWYTLVNAIASLYLLVKLFPMGRSRIIKLVLVPAFILLLTASLFKNAIDTTVYNDGGLLSSTNIDSYFAGPVAVNNAVGLKESKDVGVQNILYDMLNNMPIVNHYLPKGKTTVYLYNDYLGRIFESGNGDQIIPMVGQSYIYFGWLFCFLLSFLTVYVVRKCDIWFESTLTPIRYMAAFSSVWIALGPILNMTLILSWLYIRVVPTILVFFIYEQLACGKRHYGITKY